MRKKKNHVKLKMTPERKLGNISNGPNRIA